MIEWRIVGVSEGTYTVSSSNTPSIDGAPAILQRPHKFHARDRNDRYLAGSGGCPYSPKPDLEKSEILRLIAYGLKDEFTLSARSGRLEAWPNDLAADIVSAC
jgi:hypothetical protein